MRILLADDHTLFRDALVQYLGRANSNIEVVLAKDYYEGKQKIQDYDAFDLVILDLRMPGMDGLNGLRELKSVYPDLRVALMSGVAEPEDVNEALSIGVEGYFPKTLSGKALVRGIQTVLSGDKYIPLDIDGANIMPAYYDDAPEKNDPAVASSVNFTRRERQVLEHLVKGASNKEIARELELQEVTIKLHVRGICRKLDAKNRTQAAMYAREMNLV